MIKINAPPRAQTCHKVDDNTYAKKGNVKHSRPGRKGGSNSIKGNAQSLPHTNIKEKGKERKNYSLRRNLFRRGPEFDHNKRRIGTGTGTTNTTKYAQNKPTKKIIEEGTCSSANLPLKPEQPIGVWSANWLPRPPFSPNLDANYHPIKSKEGRALWPIYRSNQSSQQAYGRPICLKDPHFSSNSTYNTMYNTE